MSMGRTIDMPQRTIFNNVDVSSGASTTSAWIRGEYLWYANLFTVCTSAGSPVLTITAEVSPISADSGEFSAANYYTSFTITAAGTKAATWWTDYMPSVFSRPVGQARFKVAVASADITDLYGFVTGYEF